MSAVIPKSSSGYGVRNRIPEEFNILHIAYLSGSIIPSRTASSIHVMKMCQALARCGFQVTLFAPDISDQGQYANCDLFADYGVADSFEIVRGPWPQTRGGGYWYARKIAAKLPYLDVDLVIGRHLAACYFASKMKIPVIYETHGPIEEHGFLVQYLFNNLIRSPLFLFLVVISHSLRRHFEERWPILKGHIIVAPDGADLIDKNVVEADIGSCNSRLQVGYAGHLYHGKGVNLILQVARECPDFDFHIVGGADADIRWWCGTESIPKNLRFHGYKKHGEVPKYLKAFDVALLPNQPDVYGHDKRYNIGRWPSPLKLFEYMAAGRAIICSDVPVLQEIADNGVNMLVCPHDRSDIWADSLYYLAAHPELREALGATAQYQLEKKYSWGHRAKYITEHFE